MKWRIAQFAELRWWQWYLGGKSFEEYLPLKKQYWQRILRDSDVALRDGMRILDAGCGPSGVYTVLEKQQVDAIDPLLTAYRQKLKHFDPANYPWTRFRAQTIEALRASEVYDLIVCFNVINHVRDVELSLHCLLQALKPDGQLLLSVDAHRHRLLEKLFQTVPGDILHPHQHTEPVYRRMIRAAGGSVERSRCVRREFIFEHVVYRIGKNAITPTISPS